MIPYSRQWIDDDDIQAVVEVLKSDFLTTGPKVEEFEKALCDYTGANHCVVVSSGTAALHLATLVLTKGRINDYIAVPTTSFIASANCIQYSNNYPDFIDIDYDTHNINIANLEHALKWYKTYPPDCIGIIGVDMCGLPCDWERIHNLAHRHDCFVIRDASHSLGSTYKEHKTGSCQFSDITTVSFHPVKHITTGEGGAIFTNDPYIAEECRRLRNHGFRTDICPREVYTLGFNYRMTDFQAALGISQLKKLDMFVKYRREMAVSYNYVFSTEGKIQVQQKPKNYTATNSYHLYTIKIEWESELQKLGFQKLLEDKYHIKTQVHYRPIPTWEHYKRNPYTRTHESNYEQATKYANNCLSIPIYPRMRYEDVHPISIGNNIIRALEEYT